MQNLYINISDRGILITFTTRRLLSQIFVKKPFKLKSWTGVSCKIKEKFPKLCFCQSTGYFISTHHFLTTKALKPWLEDSHFYSLLPNFRVYYIKSQRKNRRKRELKSRPHFKKKSIRFELKLNCLLLMLKMLKVVSPVKY